MTSTDEPEKLAKLIIPILEPDEKIIWVGQPSPTKFRSEAWATFVFGLIPLGMSTIGWIAMGAILLKGPLLEVIGGAMCASFPLAVFTCIGFYCLTAPWRLKARIEQVVYAITDRQVIILQGIGWGQSDMVPDLIENRYNFSLKQIHKRRLIKRRLIDRVDIVFGEEFHRGSKGSQRLIQIGFLGLENHAEVYALLSEQFGSPSLPNIGDHT
jgi:hypothetical protein